MFMEHEEVFEGREWVWADSAYPVAVLFSSVVRFL